MVAGKMTKSTVAECPECEENITLKGEVQWGQQVVCPHCGNTDPIELDWVFEEYDDDYDYDDDDEDD